MLKSAFLLLILFFVLELRSQDQLGGELNYRFSKMQFFQYSAEQGEYNLSHQKEESGTITIQNIQKKVMIRTSDREKHFELLRIEIEKDTFRTLHHLSSEGQKYVLAEGPRFLTLVSTDEKVIYTRTR